MCSEGEKLMAVVTSLNGRKNGNGTVQAQAPKVVRCAIYTRKSTEEGLQQDFNSLDAQREACEAYIQSQRHEGWVALPDRYDDGGYTGANTDRPALQRLIAEIEAGKIDAVVLYKIDRISRSLMDFARLMDLFERHNVALVSVTQAFHTGSSMGRLILNILMSFSAFERDMISERTRDKLSAARRRGKWLGGTPVLGYTVQTEPVRKLAILPEEAAMVREIFQLYLEFQSLLDVARELNRRCWRTKTWVTKTGKRLGGRHFNKTDVSRILTDVTYLGQVDFKGEIFDGEHEGIIQAPVFQRVQSILAGNAVNGGSSQRNRHQALLRGLLTCGCCGRAMIHSFTKKKNKIYRYYVCNTSQKEGYDACATRSVPAQEMEDFIVAQLRTIGQNPELARASLEAVQAATAQKREALQSERQMLRGELRNLNEEARRLVMSLAQGNGGQATINTRLAEIEERIRLLERRSREVEAELTALADGEVSETAFRDAFALFDPVWDMLVTGEQTRVVQLLIEAVTYNGETGKLAIRFSPNGVNLLSKERKEA
jgi:site-specific DNA recombinase